MNSQSILDGNFALLRIGDEEIAGDFVLVRDPLCFTDATAGVVVPWRVVTAAFVTVEASEEPITPIPGARHKVGIEGGPGGWTAACACGDWSDEDPDKSALLDRAEQHLAAQRKA
jgi:hypothetical protein